MFDSTGGRRMNLSNSHDKSMASARTFVAEKKGYLKENVRLFKLWRTFDALSTIFSMVGLVCSIIFYEHYVFPTI